MPALDAMAGLSIVHGRWSLVMLGSLLNLPLMRRGYRHFLYYGTLPKSHSIRREAIPGPMAWVRRAPGQDCPESSKGQPCPKP